MSNAAKILIVATGLLISFVATRPTRVALPDRGNQDALPEHFETEAPVLVDRPLRALMVGLGQDMARISDGIWHEDFLMIEQGAESVATHPKITPDEMAAIKTALDDRFAQFVSFDKVVHEAAEQLVKAARQNDMQGVLDLQSQIRQGCVSCHATFRSEVRHALFAAELRR